MLRVRQLDGARGKRLQLHAKAFDAVVALRVPAAETLEALEQLLPAGALEHGASGAAEPAGGGDDEAAEAGGAAVLGLLRSSRRDGGGEGGGCAFLSCVRVESRTCPLHGRSGARGAGARGVGAPPLQSSRVLLQALPAMACAWHAHGTCTTRAWHMHGPCTACASQAHGARFRVHMDMDMDMDMARA